MNVKEYIDSGILETYVLGVASESERREVLHYQELHPEVKSALRRLELDMELVAENMAIKPPPRVWDSINSNIEGLITTESENLHLTAGNGGFHSKQRAEKYIEIEASNTYMRVHKAWRWIFITVFVLSKIFLILSIYYYLENRHAQDQIKELKTEVKQVR